MQNSEYNMLVGAELIAALNWIGDCTAEGIWDDLDESDLEDLSNEEITRAVKRHYSGGLVQFRLDYLTA